VIAAVVAFSALGFVGHRDTLWHDCIQQFDGDFGGQQRILLRIKMRIPIFGVAAIAVAWLVQAVAADFGLRLTGRQVGGVFEDYDDTMAADRR
jgi:hypothetical protein